MAKKFNGTKNELEKEHADLWREYNKLVEELKGVKEEIEDLRDDWVEKDELAQEFFKRAYKEIRWPILELINNFKTMAQHHENIIDGNVECEDGWNIYFHQGANCANNNAAEELMKILNDINDKIRCDDCGLIN